MTDLYILSVPFSAICLLSASLYGLNHVRKA